MTTAAEVLRAIEVSAELATVPELRLMIRNTLDLRPTLGADDQAYANALLLKLESLLREQQVDSAPPVAPDPILFDLDALLTEDADARAEALLSGLDRWLRSDVHPDMVPELFVSHSPHHASIGHPGQAESEAAINLRRLASLAAASKVDVLNRQASWIQVKSDSATGWVKMLSLRFDQMGATAKPANNNLAVMFNIASTGSGGSTPTTGVKGISEEALKNPRPNPAALKQVNEVQVSKAEVAAFAKAGKLDNKEMAYLAPAEGARK